MGMGGRGMGARERPICRIRLSLAPAVRSSCFTAPVTSKSTPYFFTSAAMRAFGTADLRPCSTSAAERGREAFGVRVVRAAELPTMASNMTSNMLPTSSVITRIVLSPISYDPVFRLHRPMGALHAGFRSAAVSVGLPGSFIVSNCRDVIALVHLPVGRIYVTLRSPCRSSPRPRCWCHRSARRCRHRNAREQRRMRASARSGCHTSISSPRRRYLCHHSACRSRRPGSWRW